MARPDTFTGTARRRQILTAAITAVNAVGYPRASLAEIARRAGVAKSAIIYYFGTRDALLLQVLQHVWGTLEARLAEAVAQHDAPMPRLRAYVEAYLAHLDTHRAEISAGVEISVSHRDADGTPIYLTGSDQDYPLLKEILREGMAVGALRTMPLGVAVMLVEHVVDIPTTALQRDLDADLGPLLPEITGLVLRGLAAD